ncbi:MAG: DUF1593 domain-containing protein [Prevotella sp.]|nr:DUF1593 domain-containing protein [Prevotella sp.]
MSRRLFGIISILCVFMVNCNTATADNKPRVVISTDIGGTDPDDNQSMAHLLMYSDCFELEGLVSSPSFGSGSKEEILRMIDLYEHDLKKLRKHNKKLMSPKKLRSICKQGGRGRFDFIGAGASTEGSDWIIKCALRKKSRPLWVLVWGGLEDLAQALHDAPEIADKIKVYWIGGPNKKWCVNSYNYIAENFPNLWMIENNASYRGFITDGKNPDKYEGGYYESCIEGKGVLGADFKNYYKGKVKMGDTPSLLYLMNGNPDKPEGESWGGSFEKTATSPKTIFTRNTTEKDTVAVYSVIEYRLTGPVTNMPAGTECFIFNIDKQDWPGYYLGNGIYAIRYAAKAPAILKYTITSSIKELNGMSGSITISALWPGKETNSAYVLGDNWYTDKQSPDLFKGAWQGYKTVEKWRKDVLRDWEKRWEWLQD